MSDGMAQVDSQEVCSPLDNGMVQIKASKSEVTIKDCGEYL